MTQIIKILKMMIIIIEIQRENSKTIIMKVQTEEQKLSVENKSKDYPKHKQLQKRWRKRKKIVDKN